MKVKEAYPTTKKAVKRLVHKYPPPAKVLDVGTRDGYGIHMLKKCGYEADGTEIDEAYAEFCKKRGYNVRCDDFEHTKGRKKYDILFSNHVIEHCEDPLNFMNSAYKVLKKNGILFIHFPLEWWKDKKHSGKMLHKSQWKTRDKFRKEVVDKSKFEEIGFYITRDEPTSDKGSSKRHIEALFIGRKGNMKNFNLEENWTDKVIKLFNETTKGADKNKKYRKSNKLKSWASLPDCLYVYLLIRYYRPENIVEVGTLTGTVTNVMWHAMLDNGYLGKIYTCDKTDVFNYWGKKPKAFPYINYYHTESSKMLSKLIKKGVKIDFCFYDAQLVKGDTKKLLKLYRGKPIFATHDFKGGEKGDKNIAKMIKKIPDGKIIKPEPFTLNEVKINSSVAVIA